LLSNLLRDGTEIFIIQVYFFFIFQLIPNVRSFVVFGLMFHGFDSIAKQSPSLKEKGWNELLFTVL
jgi:hypothetical protein